MRFLSEEHLQAVQGELDGHDAIKNMKVPEPLRTQYDITDSPEGGAIEYFLVLDNGSAQVGRGTVDDPQFTFHMAYETAAAVARKQINPTAALMSGKIKVDGNVMKLATLQGPLNAINDVMGAKADTYE